MRFPPTAILLLVWMTAVQAHARVDLLLVPPAESEPLSRRPELTLYLNNPTEFDGAIRFEAEIVAEYATAAGHEVVTLVLVDEAQRRVEVPKMSRRTVRLRPENDLRSQGEFISLRLRVPATNAIMLQVAPSSTPPMANGTATPTQAGPQPSPPPVTRRGLGRRHLDLMNDVEIMRRHISGYEPIYFAVGSREKLNARFQFSFKYRVLDPGPAEAELDPGGFLLGLMHFAYTQTSIWDLEGFSKPFYDSSYKPTLFLLHTLPRQADSGWTISFQAGAQHESNGKGGGSAPTSAPTGLVSSANTLRHPSDTRSLNTLYLLPRARWEDNGTHFFEAAFRVSAFFQIDENQDIARYRGYAELSLRGGYIRGLQLATHVRGKADGHGSLEFNLTWPTSESPLLRAIPVVGSLGGYAQIQYFNGYGESLLDYDVRRKDQLRFGLMIVR